MPSNPNFPGLDTGVLILDNELLAEKASALGNTERTAVKALAALEAFPKEGAAEERREQLADTAHAVWCYFVQRESIGLRDHRSLIRDLAIPHEVLARLGAVTVRTK